SELPPLGRTAWWTTRLRPIDRARRGSTLGQMIISVHILMNSLIVKFTVLLQTKKLSGGATEQIIDVLFAESFSRLQQRTAVSQNESIATRIQLTIGATPYQVCPAQRSFATLRQRERMLSKSSFVKGPAAKAVAFSVNRSGLVVPTIAVWMPGALRVKRSAIATLSFRLFSKKSYFRFCSRSQ